LNQVKAESEENTEMIRSLNQTIVENNERELQEARNRTFWMQLGVLILVLAVIGKLVWFVYENLDDWTDDSRWSR
jgi:Tfp pilus assembly protein PilN